MSAPSSDDNPDAFNDHAEQLNASSMGSLCDAYVSALDMDNEFGHASRSVLTLQSSPKLTFADICRTKIDMVPRCR